MRVASITCRPFRVPYRLPIKFSNGVLTHAEHILVEVRTTHGITGYGEIIPRPMIYGETIQSALAATADLIGPLIIGTHIASCEHARHQIRNVVGNPSVRAGLDQAIHDAYCRTIGLPAHVALGGHAKDVRCATVLGWDEPSKVILEAETAMRDHGLTAFKLKAGVDLRKDIAILRGVRAAVGPDVALYADANHGYGFDAARRFMDEAHQAGLFCVEEPTEANNLLARRQLCSDCNVPVLADESSRNVAEVATELLDRRADMISIKVGRTGLHESLRIRHLCEGLGAEIVVGTQGDGCIGSMVSACFAASAASTCVHPSELLYFLTLADDVVGERPTIRDGRFMLTDAPGFGFEIDDAKVERYAAGPAVFVG